MLKINIIKLLKLVAALLLAAYTFQTSAEISTSRESRHISYQVPMNKSLLVNLDQNIAKASLGAPNVADMTLLDSRQLLLRGMSIGGTNITLWDSNNHVAMVVDIEVTHNLDGIKQKLYELMPNEAIEVRNADKCIILSGQVSNIVNMDYAMKIASGYVSGGGGSGAPSASASSGCGFVSGGGGGGGGGAGGSQSIINMMQIGGEQQVMLEVKVAEVSRTVARALSLNISASSAQSQHGPFIWNVLVNQAGGAFSGSALANTLLNWSLNFSRNTSLATILAEPNLTTLSGKTASFLSGGEFPYVSNCSSTGGSCTTSFKPYGVSLKFTPVVLGSNKINLNTEVEVSQLSNTANQTLTQGLSSSDSDAVPILQSTPSLEVRGATSTIELADGQTMSIAGLISVDETNLQNQTPGLADIPGIGALFNNRQANMDNKELVILITPHLAKPIPPNQIKLPTDYYVEPDDIEFYLLGRMEGRKKQTNTNQPPAFNPLSGGTTGQFGHQISGGDPQ